MLPMWSHYCWGGESMSIQSYQEHKLKFLKMMRQNLEARLAALNAAIETIERQLSQSEMS